MKDWHDPAVLTGLSDGEIFDLIVKGKDKMVGEGDRLAPAKVWGLVHYGAYFCEEEQHVAVSCGRNSCRRNPAKKTCRKVAR